MRCANLYFGVGVDVVARDCCPAPSCQAFPFNAEPETCDAELFGAGVDICHELDDRFGRPRSQVLSQRDVPGLTRAVIPLLAARGVTALSIGANTFSASADVPPIYRWRDPASNTSVIAMQNPGGYGDRLTLTTDGSAHALHLMFNGDNAGGHSPAQVAARHAELAKRFPNARVSGATWNSYIDAITADGSAARLPEVDKEEGDTWVYGVQQDLYKTAAFRAIMRARRRCIAELGYPICGGNASAAIANSTRFALKLSEHTWGFNWGYMDEVHYTNTDLAYALANVEGFATTQNGWREQRAYVAHAVGALAAAGAADVGASRLLALTKEELAAVTRPTEPTPTAPASGWTTVDPTKRITDLPRFANVAWNATAGGIGSLTTKEQGHDYARGRGGSFGQYQYQTLTENDFWVFMNETLKVQRDVAFGKKNLTNNANVTSGFWAGTLSGMWSKKAAGGDTDGGVDSFLQRVDMDAHLHGYYGAPSRVWTLFEFSRATATVNISVTLVNKTTTRLPEAHWVDFEVAVPVTPNDDVVSGTAGTPAPPPVCDSWSLSKLGSSLCASDVSLFGSTHIHAVSDSDAEHGSVSLSGRGGADAAAVTFRLTTYDAALLSLECVHSVISLHCRPLSTPLCSHADSFALLSIPMPVPFRLFTRYKTAFPNPVHKDLDKAAPLSKPTSASAITFGRQTTPTGTLSWRATRTRSSASSSNLASDGICW